MSIENIEEMKFIIESLLNDDRIPDAPDFDDEQWAALCEEAEMTEEIFDSCLYRCHSDGYGVIFFSIVKQFPQFAPKYSQDVLDAYRWEWEAEREKNIAKYGDNSFFS